MCGISGFYSRFLPEYVPSSDRQRVIEAMTSALAHRGPDGFGYYVNQDCALGHRRLRIIDLSENGKQPMSDREGTVFVSFNGEIYNFRSLRRELEKKYEFRSLSDTEVIVYGYREWGGDVFRRLNGMFAIAIWDDKARRLVLARDRLGKKPLFYSWDGLRCVFGSELKALMQFPGLDRRIDTQSLAQYLQFGYVPTPRSILQGTFKVARGSSISFDSNGMFEQQYWRLPNTQIVISEDEAVEELDRLLNEAVKIRLESDVPLGFLLSGGIDSSLVTAIASKLVGEIHTFSIGFQSPRYDEAQKAKAVAKYLGTQHRELYLEETEFASFLPKAPRYFDEPFADSSLIATYFLSKITKEVVTVALTGDGGDELFCGYPKYLNLQRALPFQKLPLALRRAAASVGDAMPHDQLRKTLLAIGVEGIRHLQRWLVSIWKTNELDQLFPEGVDWGETVWEQTAEIFANRNPVAQLMAIEIGTYLCDDILQKMDRSSMAVALEVRSPLLDYNIVEFAVSLPFNLHYKDGVQKRLIRKLLSRYIPRPLWDRKKQGLEVPVADWYRRGRRAEIWKTVNGLAKRYPDFSRAKMEQMVKAHETGRRNYGQKLFVLDMLNLWSETYL